MGIVYTSSCRCRHQTSSLSIHWITSSHRVPSCFCEGKYLHFWFECRTFFQSKWPLKCIIGSCINCPQTSLSFMYMYKSHLEYHGSSHTWCSGTFIYGHLIYEVRKMPLIPNKFSFSFLDWVLGRSRTWNIYSQLQWPSLKKLALQNQRKGETWSPPLIFSLAHKLTVKEWFHCGSISNCSLTESIVVVVVVVVVVVDHLTQLTRT